MRQYEAMFLFDPTFGGSMENCEKEIRRLMDRAGAEIVFCRRWDERRLAYRIAGRKRGVYVLVYFRAEQDKIVGIERDAQLSEPILRILVLRADGVTPEMMDRWVSGGSAEDAAQEGAGDAPAPGKPASEPRREESLAAAKAPADAAPEAGKDAPAAP